MSFFSGFISSIKSKISTGAQATITPPASSPVAVPTPLLPAFSIPSTLEEKLQDIEEKLEDAENFLQEFNANLDFSANAAYQFAIARIGELDEAIKKETKKSFQKILKIVLNTNIAFLEEGSALYEKSVKSQFLSFLSPGRRKKLKLLKPFIEELQVLKQSHSQATTLKDLHALIASFSDMVHRLMASAEEKRINLGNFQELLEEMTHQIHPLLRLQQEFTQEKLTSSFLPYEEEIKETFKYHYFEAKRSLNETALTTAKPHILASKKGIAQASQSENADAFSWNLNASKFSLLGVTSTLQKIRSALEESMKTLLRRIPEQAQEYKVNVTTHQTESIRKALTPVVNNYQRCTENLIIAYQTRIRAQWFWRFRTAQKKISLLKKYTRSEISLTQIQQSSLNNGQFQILIGKLAEIELKNKELDQELQALNQKSLKSSPVLSENIEASVDYLEPSLKWLDRIVNKTSTAVETLDQASEELSPLMPQGETSEQKIERKPQEESLMTATAPSLERRPLSIIESLPSLVLYQDAAAENPWLELKPTAEALAY